MFSRITNLFIACIMLIALVGIPQTTAQNPEAMKAVQQGTEKALNAHDIEQWLSYFTDDAVFDYVPAPPPMEGKEALRAFITNLFQAFPDIHSDTQRILTSGNILVNEYVISATHLGEWAGIPATGKSGQVMHFNITEFEGDKIKRLTTYLDNVSVLVQLGVMPAGELPELTPSFTLPDPEPTGLAPLEADENARAAWNAHDLANYAKLIHLDVEVLIAPLGVPINREAFIASQEIYFLSSSDLHAVLVRRVDMGDGWVLAEVVFKSTNDGPHGFFGTPATGRFSEVRGAYLARYDTDGLMTNLNVYFDNLTSLTQLGLFPPPADTEANKAIVRRTIEEIWNQRKLDIADEVYAADYVNHDPTGDYIGLEARKQFIATYISAFPDIHFTIEDIVAEGDKVAIRWTATGTHKGEIMGIPPTGVYGTNTGISIVRIADGKIVEEWSHWDVMGLLEHLGVIPPTRKDYTWGKPSEVTGAPGDLEENKSIVRRYVEEGWNQQHLDVLDEFMSPDIVNHEATLGRLVGLEAHKQGMATYLTAFPDFHVVMDDLFAEGDIVVLRWTATGTQKGELLNIPSTGKQAVWNGITIFRFADGKIVEMWWSWDTLGLLKQLGVIPSMQPKDYTNVFFMPLASGLNMVSLPLEPITPYTARSFSEMLSATVVIKLDEKRQRFVGFTLDAPDDGFVIEGGKGYIVNVPETKVVAFTGAAWTNQPPVEAAPILTQNGGAWAFVVSGRFFDDSDDSLKRDGYLVTVRNTRTNTVATDAVREGYFAAAFADLTRKDVVQTGDRLEVQVRNRAGEIVSDTLLYTVTAESIRQAFLLIRLKNIEIPRQSLLLQNYPNPFNPETWIPYQIREPADVLIRIYNAKGQLVHTLNLGQRTAGFFLGRDLAAYWDGHNDAGEKVASGVYFYQLQAGKFSATRRMLVLK